MNSDSAELQQWYSLFGSPTVDTLFIALLTPLSALAFMLNVMAYFILREKSFQKIRFYKLLRWYALNNAIASLILTFAFTNQTYTIFTFTNSYATMLYGGYFQLTLILSFYFLLSLYEIFILFERIKYFLPARFGNYKLFKLDKLCYFLLVFSIFVNLPNSFILAPSFLDVELRSNSSFRIYYMGPTEFGQTIIFRVMNCFIFAIRDVLTLLTKLALNVIAKILIRQYMARINKEKNEFANRISSDRLHFNVAEPNQANQANQAVGYISEMQRKQIYLALIRSTFSVLKHLFCITSFLLIYFDSTIPNFLIFYLFLLMISVECFSNIFILFNFYELFRAEFKKKMRFIQYLSNYKLFKTK